MSRIKLSLQGKETGKGYLKQEIERATEAEKFLNNFDGEEVIIPPFLKTEQEKEVYMFLVNELLKINLFTNIDSIQLGMWVQLYSKYLETVELLENEPLLVDYTNKGGNENKVENPALKLNRMLIRDMLAISKGFPFNPLQRLAYRDLYKEKEQSLADLLAEDDEE